MKTSKFAFGIAAALLVLTFIDWGWASSVLLAAEGAHHGGSDLGSTLPLWSIIPFAGILLSIALLPLLAPEFWHHHFPKVSAFWAIIFAVPFLFAYGGEAWYEILHIYLVDYIPFIILLWGLFTVSGGLLVRGKLTGTPIVNTVFLLIGTIIASWVGTTGAAMILIRPVIRSNKERKSKVHIIVFFIFLVANIGGSLTPLGDPPLFLGFLHGVSFFWTLKLLPMMSFVSVILLVLFFLIDAVLYNRERKIPGEMAAAGREKKPIKVLGLYNLIFLMGIMGSVLMSGMVKLGEVNVGGVHMGIQNFLRDILIIIMGLLSLYFTPKAIREDFNSALGQLLPGIPEAQAVPELMTTHEIYLKAISCGAVFMGAMTYIGNAPNFMVRSIAEESGIKMPSFFGFMVYSICILIPLFFLVTMIFF